jgi:Cro/C1-type HTH DNA-binding domain
MEGIDSKRILWANVSALMTARWGEENLNRLAREAKIGPASADRLKKQRTSVGLDVVDKIAKALSVDAWQLFVPGLEPANMPTLLPLSEAERAFYSRMLEAAKTLQSKQDD